MRRYPLDGEVGPVTNDPRESEWTISASGPHPGYGMAPTVVTGHGADEASALRDLDDRLRGVPQPNESRPIELRRRLRLAYVAGAEEWAEKSLGRTLTNDELRRVLARFDQRSVRTY